MSYSAIFVFSRPPVYQGGGRGVRGGSTQLHSSKPLSCMCNATKSEHFWNSPLKCSLLCARPAYVTQSGGERLRHVALILGRLQHFLWRRANNAQCHRVSQALWRGAGGRAKGAALPSQHPPPVALPFVAEKPPPSSSRPHRRQDTKKKKGFFCSQSGPRTGAKQRTDVYHTSPPFVSANQR